MLSRFRPCGKSVKTKKNQPCLLSRLIPSKPPDEPGFDRLRQSQITADDARDNGPEGPGQGGKAKAVRKIRRRQSNARRTNSNRRQNQRPACAALNERNLVRADNVNDQGLRQNRLDEPCGLEHRGLFGRVRAKAEIHDGIGDIIENRTHRSHKHHKLGNMPDVPTSRFG